MTNTEAKSAPRLNYKKVTLVYGKKKKLKVRGTKKRVKWYSAKKSVATVNKKGVVKAKKKDKATIIAKVGNVSVSTSSTPKWIYFEKNDQKSLTVVANSTETKNPECKSPGFFSFLELRLL